MSLKVEKFMFGCVSVILADRRAGSEGRAAWATAVGPWS
jgi:hypothetical protein